MWTDHIVWNANWNGKEFPGNYWLLPSILHKIPTKTLVWMNIKMYVPLPSWQDLLPIGCGVVCLMPSHQSTLLWRFDSSQVRFGSFRCSCGQFLFVAVASSSSPSSSPSSCYTVNICQHNIHFHSHFLHLDFLHHHTCLACSIVTVGATWRQRFFIAGLDDLDGW